MTDINDSPFVVLIGADHPVDERSSVTRGRVAKAPRNDRHVRLSQLGGHEAEPLSRSPPGNLAVRVCFDLVIDYLDAMDDVAELYRPPELQESLSP